MRRKKSIRAVALAAAASLILTTGAFASGLGTQIIGYDTSLGTGMELAKGVYWTGSDYQTENYIEYTPNTTVHPAVVSGSKVCNYGNFGSMANLLEKEGKHVVAGINGDYFVVATNEPLGVVIQNGELLSTDAGHYAMGFMADGTPLFGSPSIAVGVDINGTNYGFDSINKNRRDGGATVYTDDYAYKTNNSGEGTDIICSYSGTVTASCKLTLTVDEIITTGGSVSIPTGKIVLSVSTNATDALKTAIAGLAAGSTVTLNTTCATGWDKVSCAVGSLYKLITNGALDSSIPSDTELAPRTAVGVKADGTILFYTIDGRQSGESVGLTIQGLAKRLLEMGCVEATIMDGGGSTTMNAIYLGDSSVSQVNSPSDGYQRSVSDYIMLVTEAKATGTAASLQLYPLMTNILSGATTTFSLKGADANGYAATINTTAALEVTNDIGTIASDGTFKATTAGSGALTATASGLTGASVQINVVATPDTIYVADESTDNAISSLSTTSGTVTSLTAWAVNNHVWLTSQDSCYTWTVEGNIGTIAADGTFTAGTESATGSIKVTAGDKTVTIPVTVTNPISYTDVTKNDWFYGAVQYVSEMKAMNGTSEKVFSPNTEITRAMAVTVLYRMEGSPAVTESANFSDVEAGSWYADAVSWAAAKGIVQGYNGEFSPGVSITREQLAAVLYRYAGSPATEGSLDAYTDSTKVSSWASDAMCWAVNMKLISGLSATELSPGTTATRAQLATIIYRMAEQ